jgi:hypothetical protein
MSTVRASESVVDAIAESVRPAAEVVFEGIELARIELERLIDTNKTLGNLRQPECAHQYISLGRHLLREHINANEADMGGWNLNRQVTSNGAILLHNGLQHVRLLHHRSKTAAPHAGSNRARAKYFSNAPAADPGLIEHEQNLLFLWQIWDSSESRLVHTLTPGSYGRSPLIDVDVTVHRDEEDFGGYSFNGDPDAPLVGWNDDDIDAAEFTGTGHEAP